ncbi:Oxidoreductase ptaL [Lachnellula suecica]|uniref:Oxidoreductase ptaL n=1 Tax=Lachnellula suecica TaxID=602035 RepID=A0A8T9BWF5_9HELO|nr:Oxidoreductase ptaL [Lachnellula suecica]
MATAATPYEIVIIGANFAGLGVAHYLIRKTIPELQKLDESKSFHITVVTPNTDMFFKIAAPRVLLNATAIPESKVLRPLSEGLSKYKPEQLTLTQARATGHDAAKRTVTITPVGSEASKDLHYDSLFIATGTTSASPLWTLHADQSLTSTAFKSLHAALPTAKTVYIAGGGAVGLETAGEIATTYPNAKVTLLSGGTSLLPRISPAVGARAESYVKSNSVAELVHNLRVVSSDTSKSPNTVTLSDGSTREVDLCIDATGGKANSQFLQADWLDETGRVLTRDAYFRVKGNGSDDVEGVYVVGDIVAGSNNTAIEVDAMVPTAASAFAVDFARKVIGVSAEPAKSGLLASLFGMFAGKKAGPPSLVEYKPMKDTILVPIGPGGGVGQLMGWKVPSFFVGKLKGQKFLMELVEPALSGDKWPKA